MPELDVNVDATLLGLEGVVSRPVRVGDEDSDFHVAQTGGASETTLAAVLAALGAPVEVDGTVSLSAATLAALEQITVSVSGTVPVSGTVSVTEPVTVDGAVALDAATLAALENIVVSGTVALDAPTLAALETINAVVSGNVTVSNFPATQAISAASLPLPAGAATAALQDAVLAALVNRYGGGKDPVTATVTASGDTVIRTPAAGNRIDLYWASAVNRDDNAQPSIQIKLASDSDPDRECYRLPVLGHWEKFVGAVDAPLIVNLSTAALVDVTAHIIEVTP